MCSRRIHFRPESFDPKERPAMNKQDGGKEEGRAKRPAKKRFRVLPGKKVPGADVKPAKIRVVDDDERLTPKELKQRFADNLDRLLSLVGLNRKDGAVEIGVSYRLLRRLVTAGVSRPDDRNLEGLTKIARFFCLADHNELWNADMVRRLLAPGDERGFVEKFRSRLQAVRKKRLFETGPERREELALLSRALGFEEVTLPPLTGPDADKVATILASPEAGLFRQLIGKFYELATWHRAAESVTGENEHAVG